MVYLFTGGKSVVDMVKDKWGEITSNPEEKAWTRIAEYRNFYKAIEEDWNKEVQDILDQYVSLENESNKDILIGLLSRSLEL